MDTILSIEQIEEVVEEFTEMLVFANRTGNVSQILEKFGIDCHNYTPCEYEIAKILVIGYPNVKITDLRKVVKEYGLDEKRFEFVIQESDIKHYPMQSLKNNCRYSDIFIGPIPHKTTGMGNCSSIIAEIKNNQDQYPKLTELRDSNKLKISKKSFSNAILNSELFKNLKK